MDEMPEASLDIVQKDGEPSQGFMNEGAWEDEGCGFPGVTTCVFVCVCQCVGVSVIVCVCQWSVVIDYVCVCVPVTTCVGGGVCVSGCACQCVGVTVVMTRAFFLSFASERLDIFRKT